MSQGRRPERRIGASRRWAGFPALVAVLTILALPGQAASPVILAIVGPLAGDNASIGQQFQLGAETALADRKVTSLLGRTVQPTVLDDACNVEQATAVARKLIDMPPALVLGHSCSHTTLAVAPLYAAAKILEITPSSTNPRITELGIPTLFRMIGRDDRQGKAAAALIAGQFAGKRLAVLSQPSVYSQGLSQITLEELHRLGVREAMRAEYISHAEHYWPVIEQLKQQAIDLVYITGAGIDCALLLHQARNAGLTPQVISADTAVTDMFRETAGDAAEGVIFSFPPRVTELASAASVVARFRASGVEPTGYTLLSYAAVEVWLEGVQRAGQIEAGAVAAAIRAAPTDTILGPVRFDAKGDIITEREDFVWYVWRDGRRIPYRPGD